jgi:hypothetical protein
MRKKEFIAIEERLAPRFPGFAIQGPLMLMKPLGEILRGFHFEPSSFSNTQFYVTAFFLPLYVPTKQIHFTFGHRIGATTKRWTAGQPHLENTLASEMRREMPFLEHLATPKDVASALYPFTKPNQNGYVNPHSYEALAYTLLRAGETEHAMQVIDTLLRNTSPTIGWEKEIALRVLSIRDLFRGDPAKVERQLTVWQAATLNDLGLGHLEKRTH